MRDLILWDGEHVPATVKNSGVPRSAEMGDVSGEPSESVETDVYPGS
jgi:hypothetical protein